MVVHRQGKLNRSRPAVTLHVGFTADFGGISVTEGTGLAREWVESGSEPAPVLELSMDQIDTPASQPRPVLDLGTAMEVVPSDAPKPRASDPFVRIRDARPRPAQTAVEAQSPVTLPQLDDADWKVVLSSSEAALDQALSAALHHAATAKGADDRSRAMLYRAISAAYDLALTVRDAPDHYAALLDGRGITALPRAPMTPIVKLVFGADYDKTRLAEYAAVLTHAARYNVGWGQLEELLAETTGGIKAIVALERQRHAPAVLTQTKPRPVLAASMAKRLRSLPSAELDQTCRDGEEFAMVMVRRTPNGSVEIVGEVPSDPNLMRKAAKAVLASHSKA